VKSVVYFIPLTSNEKASSIAKIDCRPATSPLFPLCVIALGIGRFLRDRQGADIEHQQADDQQKAPLCIPRKSSEGWRIS